MTDSVIFELDGGVARVTLNRPRAMNSFDRALVSDLASALDEVERRTEVKAMVLTGAGAVFSAGADLGLIREALASGDMPTQAAAFVQELHGVLLRVHEARVPVVCAINGPCAGGGLGLALSGDITWASDEATFRGAFTGIGLTPDTGSSYLLTRAVGERAAREILLTNRRIDANEALRLGLVSRVVPAAALLDEATGLAQRLAAGATGALVKTREILGLSMRNDLASQLDVERASVLERFGTRDFAEGVAAFLEKRAPKFE